MPSDRALQDVSATASLDKKGSLAPQFLSCLALVASAFKVWGWGTSWKLRSAIRYVRRDHGYGW